MQKILVVDDDDMNLKMAEFILKKDMKDIEVILADSGMKCIDLLQREKVDLVLLDFQMPMMNGLKTLEIIRKREDMRYSRHLPDGFIGSRYGSQSGYDGRSGVYQETVHAERSDRPCEPNAGGKEIRAQREAFGLIL